MKATALSLLTSSIFLGAASVLAGPLSITESKETIAIKSGEVPVLTYHKAIVQPPEGEAASYARSGFIHPLHSPSGGVVSSIHAPDHIHHMGLWHAWVNTKHRDRKLDFWNLKAETATVRYSKTLKIDKGKDSKKVGFTVLQEHVSYSKEMKSKDPKPEIVLKEAFTVTVSNEDKINVIDYQTVQTNVTDAALTFPAYRYGGGIAYRAPLHWRKENSDYLTSKGKTRLDGHTTRGNWCAMWGPTDKGGATLAILCHPENHDAPQRMRIWPPNSAGGAIFFNYVPIQEKPWSLEPGKPVTMRYRILISDGKPDRKALDQAWESYGKKP